MPTVKCSTCGLQVEISLMGEHVCAGSTAAERTIAASSIADLDACANHGSLATPPLPAVSLFGRFMPAFGNSNAATEKQQPRAPPQVDTSAASTCHQVPHLTANVTDGTLDRAFLGQGELTPVSLGSASMTPQTPDGRAGAGKTGEYFAPQIVNDSPPRRPGGYGGLDEGGGLEPAFSPNPPRKQGPDLMERMNTITPGPFVAYRRPSAGGRSISGDLNDRPGTSASNFSNISSGKGPRAQRQNGYGGFGTPPRARGDLDEPPLTPNRSESYPRPSDSFIPPPRSPSAPPSASRLRSDRLQPLDSPGGPDRPVPPTGERFRRPSRGPDTSRPPPPRSASIRPTTPVVPTINLAEEFGIGNPFHAPSESSSSNGSENSNQLFDRRPSQASQASSRTSPPRSLPSRSGGRPSDATSFDNLVSDIQSSMDEMNTKPKPPPLSPLSISAKDIRDRPSPLSARLPPSERGYDPRIDPAIQNPRYARGRSPVSSPLLRTPLQNELTVHAPGDILSPASAALPSPRWTRSPERIEDQLPPHQHEPRSARERSRSRARNPAMQPPSRGNCKACGLVIKGKSISSADGRLTGRYHKPCFVCSTCQEPFSSSTFYVLDDRPYCEQHYHKLNGSLCGSCNRGIEGQYLEDESAVKHHVGCFKCAQCRMALRDGYFEVNGRAYCEKDAWRLVQQPWMANGGMRSSGPGGSPNMGLPGGPRGFGPAGGMHGQGRMGPGPRPRMEKRMTRLGMM